MADTRRRCGLLPSSEVDGTSKAVTAYTKFLHRPHIQYTMQNAATPKISQVLPAKSILVPTPFQYLISNY